MSGVAAASVAAGSAWVRIGFVYVSSSRDFWCSGYFLVFLVYLVDRAGGSPFVFSKKGEIGFCPVISGFLVFFVRLVFLVFFLACRIFWVVLVFLVATSGASRR